MNNEQGILNNEIKEIMNNEQGISNDEIKEKMKIMAPTRLRNCAFSFYIHYSLFDIRYYVLIGKLKEIMNNEQGISNDELDKRK